MPYKDTLQKFLFERSPVRGELVHLDATWQAILERQEYPEPVRKILGEMLAAVVLLSATLKLNGRMIIQLRGNGPINLMMVECANSHEVRGLAHWQSIPEQHDLKSLFGNGTLSITLEPKEEQTQYQSVVEIVGDSLSDALSNYLKQSEQLETALWLASDESSASGMLIQRMPEVATDEDVDAWNRIHHLSSTIKEEELLKLSMLDILHRLFHEEQVRVFEPAVICFRCSCSSERVVSMLRGLGHAEAKSIIEEKGSIDVACEFCNHKYEFDQIDVEEIFASDVPPASNTTRH